jgi:gas vesicle protein
MTEPATPEPATPQPAQPVGAETAADRAVLLPAIALVELALRACTAYGREDLARRLTGSRRTLADPAVHIVVVGEFKQGKSSLVNALLGASVCPVADDVATAVPTFVRYGQEQDAALMIDAEPPRRVPVPMDQVRQWAVEGAEDLPLPDEGGGRLGGVEVRIPRTMLAGGLVVVDTPGVGGLGSAKAAASLAAISMADAVLFVTDASQEFTRTELEFMRQARASCETIACVLTKTDFYPAWRRIRDLNRSHLDRAVPGVPLMAVSSTLRTRAVKTGDTAMNQESGFADLVAYVNERIGGGAAGRRATEAAAEVMGVCDQLLTQFESEKAVLADPAEAQRVIQVLTETRERVEALKNDAAKWNQTLNDGIADLTADIDHDLRYRVRRIIEEADTEIEAVDPADTWAQMEPWLQSRVAQELLGTYHLLRDRSEQLSEQVADHFRRASGEALKDMAVYNPLPLVSQAHTEHQIELEKMRVGKQAMVALKSAYGGVLMFTMMGALTGISLGPIGVGIGLVMGRKGLRDEKKRQLTQRRTQAKNAVRRYSDEVNFMMGKDSRDTLRRIQRQLRDHYSALAEELNRSNAQALAAATEAANRGQAEREQRLRDIEAELGRIRQVRERALAVGQ